MDEVDTVNNRRVVEYWRKVHVSCIEDLRADYVEELDGIRGLLLMLCGAPVKFAKKVLTMEEGECLQLRTRWTFYHEKLQKYFEAWIEIVGEE